MSIATGTKTTFRFGLLAIAMLGLGIVLASGNDSTAQAQSDDASGDQAAISAQDTQTDQNAATDAGSTDPQDAAAEQAQNAADAAAEALDAATEARDQLESDGAPQDQIDAANQAVAKARFDKDNADAAVKSADDAASQ